MKVSLNGSRRARTGLDLAGALSADMATRLVPTEAYAERAFPRIAGVVLSAATDRFVTDILQQ